MPRSVAYYALPVFLLTVGLSSFGMAQREKISVQYSDQTIEFYLPGISDFEYQLKGRELRWIPLEGPRLNFTELDAGEYVLTIRKKVR
jgi:hypothetical protein